MRTREQSIICQRRIACDHPLALALLIVLLKDLVLRAGNGGA